MSIPQYIHQVPHIDSIPNSIQMDHSYSDLPSPYPPTPYRTSRNTHASNIPSWNSFGFPHSANSSRPLPVPIQRPRGLSASSQWPSEPTHDYTRESGMSERDVVGRDIEAQPGEEDEGYGEGEYEEGATEPSTEHVTVEAFPEVENGMPQAGPSQTMRKGAKAFVGGFVSGIRHLPRLMVRTDHKTLKKGAPEYATHDPEALPVYEEASQLMPGPSNVQYVQAMEMPDEHVAHLSYDSNDGTQQPARSPSEHHNDEHGQALSPPRSQMFSPPAHAALALPPRIVATPPPVGSPVLVEPRPTRDYAKMDSPVRTAPPDDSFSAHITRIHNFLVELKNLPWVSARVTDDYYPEKSHRARDPKIKPGSWYSTRQHHEIDLLATPAAMKRTAEVPRSEDNSVVRSRRTLTMTSTCSSQVQSAFHHYAAGLASHGSPVASLRRHSRRTSYRSYHAGGFHLPQVPNIASMSMNNGITMGVDSEGRPVYVIPAANLPSISSPPPTSQASSHVPTNVPYPGSTPSNTGDQKRSSAQP